MRKQKFCSVNECVRKHLSRGMCSKHYSRWRTHGDPLKALVRRGDGGTRIETFWSLVSITADDSKCWLWVPHSSGKYGQVSVNNRQMLAHRYAFLITNGYLPPVVRHKCDTPLCVNPKHLEPGTAQENMRDKVHRGRSASGERNGSAKLNRDAVDQIRKLLANGVSGSEIACQFGVGTSTISRVRRGVNWR